MRYIVEIFDFNDKKVVSASWIELDVVLKILDAYKAFPKITIKGYDYTTKGEQDERNQIV